MGLFDRKKPVINNTFLNVAPEDEAETAVNYNTVLDYLLGLSDDDYEKMLKVAKVYRDANKKAAEIIGAEGVELETMGDPLKTEILVKEFGDDEDAIDDFLNDELETAFIEDAPKSTKKASKNVGRN